MAKVTHSQLYTLANLPWLEGLPNHEYSHLETDSRKVNREAVFFALPGVASNGWDYLDAVADLGCLTAVVPAGLGLKHTSLELIEVEDVAELLVSCLHQCFGALPKQMVAVTGTNGKSSICFYLAQLAKFTGLKSGLVGTFGVGELGKLQEAVQTTPDLLRLHKTLIELSAQGVDFVAFEASSHALDQGRLQGVAFQGAIFSNLSRDHLDYHGDMASYAAAKKALFAFPSVEHSVFCLDDDYSDFMSQDTLSKRHYYSFSDSSADFYVEHLSFLPTGCEFQLVYPEGRRKVFLPLLGRFNVQNALAALAALWHLLPNKDSLLAGLERLQGAPGRMEKVVLANTPVAVVDYAHTPDALRVALQALRDHSAGKLICVFGCGGDRDRGKRPLMMAEAMANADSVFLTSDNPRTEDVGQILADAQIGLASSEKLTVIADRREAIAQAILTASADDVILIAGKGHENYQDVQGVKHHFDDKEEALGVLQRYVD
ncbi:UDP-N-acetylmuramoyl-L-alanyl-D-glutamate--2,6-diaminopimelate ligase [Marinomonas dokdonensis]|uniref:UDP-N-acetylmuramoyl-L-alanyl-D-glutamate--2, 6-diaminopimelate ligase n=1 Tax=Marinomonas dokdonensis TaxID=328224 RepID=UPI0040557E06